MFIFAVVAYSESRIYSEAKSMFEEILRVLRKRRVDDELSVMNSRIESTENEPLHQRLEHDPAKKDAELNARLKSSHEVGLKNEEKVKEGEHFPF